MKNNSLLITIVVAVIVGVITFFGGMKYQQSQSPAMGAQGQFARGAQAGRFGTGRRNGFGGATVGEITSLDANSMTLKLPDGSSKIVNLSDTTTISKTDTAAKTDLKVGERVAAIGASNSDGSITAQNVQLNPMFRNGPNGGRTTSPTQSQ